MKSLYMEIVFESLLPLSFMPIYIFLHNPADNPPQLGKLKSCLVGWTRGN